MRECPNRTLALELRERSFVAHALARGGGVSSLFACDGRPAFGPAVVAAALIADTNRSEFIHGQPARILAGPFANFVGSLARLDANGRAPVLLDIMGGTVPITVQRSTLSRSA